VICPPPWNRLPTCRLGADTREGLSADEKGLFGNVFRLCQVGQVNPIVEMRYDLLEAHGCREAATVSFCRHPFQLVAKGLFKWVVLQFLLLEEVGERVPYAVKIFNPFSFLQFNAFSEIAISFAELMPVVCVDSDEFREDPQVSFRGLLFGKFREAEGVNEERMKREKSFGTWVLQLFVGEPMNVLFLVDIQDPQPVFLPDIFNVELAYLLTPCACEKGKDGTPEIGRVQECVFDVLGGIEDVFQILARVR